MVEIIEYSRRGDDKLVDKILSMIELMTVNTIEVKKLKDITYVIVNNQLLLEIKADRNDVEILFNLKSSIITLYPLKLSEYDSVELFEKVFQRVFKCAYDTSVKEKYRTETRDIQ
jgi:hypothetical protein